ncbi:MAG TPA: Crp/Fnr family transcriptional regulator [Casimicrobiaceae bacterium]|nr:Crp/Fnr family transcriptional regulator [Casimicrobiaceae bacterium]
MWPWSVGLDAEQLNRVNNSLTERTVRRGLLVCRTGEDARYWYGVLDGLVKMSTVTAKGEDLSFIGIATGGWFGEGTLLKAERRRYDIITLRDSRLVLMPRKVFLSLVESSPPFAQWLLFQLNERLSQFIALLANDRTSSTDVRIARTLAWMFNPYLYPGMARDIPITQDEIAHLANVSRSRTNEALHRLASANLVQIGYGHVTVVDIEGLREFDG